MSPAYMAQTIESRRYLKTCWAVTLVAPQWISCVLPSHSSFGLGYMIGFSQCASASKGTETGCAFAYRDCRLNRTHLGFQLPGYEQSRVFCWRHIERSLQMRHSIEWGISRRKSNESQLTSRLNANIPAQTIYRIIRNKKSLLFLFYEGH